MKPISSEGARALEVVVCLEDSILDVLHLRQPGQVRAGHDPGCQVVLPAEALGGQGSVVLASLDASGQAYAATALDGQGSVRPLAASDQVSLEVGALRVFVRTVPDIQTVARGGWGLDARALKVAGASLAGHLAFVWLLLAIPHDARAVNGMDFWRNEHFVRVSTMPNEAPKEEPPPPGQDGATGAQAAEGASTAAHSGDPGKMGTPDTRTRGTTAMAGHDATDKPSAAVIAQARSAGILGVMHQTDWSPILSGDERFASNDVNVYGSDLGEPPGNGAGTYGAGYVGNATGGCPPGTRYCSDSSIGTGRYDTIGYRPGSGYTGQGPGGGLHPRGHDPRSPTQLGPITVGPDGLDKQIIKRYIRGRLEAISYCYERQLSVRSNLGGTITVEFVIGPNGGVISARGDGSAGAREVDECVLGQVRGIQFPRSQGMTNVKYPFTFHTAGQ